MRELTETETESIEGGNLFVAGVVSIVSSFSAGQWAGEQINAAVNRTFSMSTGTAAYYTFSNK